MTVFTFSLPLRRLERALLPPGSDGLEPGWTAARRYPTFIFVKIEAVNDTSFQISRFVMPLTFFARRAVMGDARSSP